MGLGTRAMKLGPNIHECVLAVGENLLFVLEYFEYIGNVWPVVFLLD